MHNLRFDISMNKDRKLALILIVLLVFSLLLSGVNLLQKLGIWQKIELSRFLPQSIKTITRVETTQKVISEESGVIEVVEKASPSVVSVLEKAVVFDLFRGPVIEESSIGTGFAVESDLVVTNRHVVADKDAEYTVVTKDGDKLKVINIYRDSLNDLALLKVQDGNLPSLELGDSDILKVGQTVVAIGNALGRFSNTVTKGVVSGIGRGITATSGLGSYQRLEDVIQTDAALSPGNSGGPLLNLSSQVIGVNVAVTEQGENIGFAIPSNLVSELVENFLANKKISRPFLGVNYNVVTAEMASAQGLPEGVFIVKVVSGSAADKAGVKPNDIITHVGGIKINSENTLASLILKHKVGEKVELSIWRNGKEIELETVLQEAPEE